MMKEYTKQVMHKAIAHHPLTDAQPVPEQWAATPWLTPTSFIVQHDIIWYGISLWPVGVSCPGCVPFHLLVHSQPPRWQGSMRS